MGEGLFLHPAGNPAVTLLSGTALTVKTGVPTPTPLYVGPTTLPTSTLLTL